MPGPATHGEGDVQRAHGRREAHRFVYLARVGERNGESVDHDQKLSCNNEQARRNLLLNRPDFNGIDYVEVDAVQSPRSDVFFLKPVGPLNPVNPADPNDEYGLSTNLAPITINGGARIVGIKPVSCTRQPDGSLTHCCRPAGRLLDLHVDHRYPGPRQAVARS